MSRPKHTMKIMVGVRTRITTGRIAPTVLRIKIGIGVGMRMGTGAEIGVGNRIRMRMRLRIRRET